MRGESVTRPSGRTLPVANRLAICSSVVVALASSLLLTAQNVVLTGALTGRVTDQSGAVVTGASVVVQNVDGVNPLQYNPIGTNCGDGSTLKQTCCLVPNSGPGNFGALQEISPLSPPRVLQFSARFTF
jgi:hypothetical protein